MLVLVHARLWDGTGAAVQPDVDLLIDEGRIVAIGSSLPVPEGTQTLDLAGATVLPGLIDAHVHVASEPGQTHRNPTPEHHAELVAAHLRAYVACGVTTVLDTGILPDDLATVRALEAQEAVMPRFLTLGTLLAPEGGYPANVIPAFPTVGTPTEVARALDLLVDQGAVGVKTTVEQGLFGHGWPLYTPEVAAAIREGAAERGLRIFTHAMSVDEQDEALDLLAPAVFVHPPDRPNGRLRERLVAAGVAEISTLTVVDEMRGAWEPERFTDPLTRLVVPEEQLATALDRDARKAFLHGMLEVALPAMPAKGLVASMVARESTVRGRLRRQGAALRDLADAGVPIVLGSDSGSWPLIPYAVHGPTTLRELGLLVDAGFTPEEALTAGTRTAADVLGLDDVGTVEVGNVADLVIVDGDPLQDVGVLWHTTWVVRGGEVRTPEAWVR
ncbi:MAG: amidohydrolase family protein [Myxococcales bacterium]|nr:amidohydrolase family protein [Myxococcales bacterium]